jgi:gliding motility-associated-like protein
LSNGAFTQSVTISQTGRYSVTIKDAQGRKSLPSDSVSVTVYDIPSLSDAAITEVLCFGGSTGSAMITASGGFGPYQYGWSNGQTSSEATGLAEGSYNVIVTDSHFCTASASIIIKQPALLTVRSQLKKPLCPDASDGAISINIDGGTAPYSLSWNGATSDTIISGLAAASYEVIVSDANNCTLRQNIQITDSMEVCMLIPTIITPNGDGHNDTWEIGGIYVYPDATVEVFDRLGKRVFYSRGYPVPWDGKYNGNDLPMDSYHFVIDLHNGKKPLIGIITIVR